MAREDQEWAPVDRDDGKRFEEALEVLVTSLQREREDDRPLTQFVALPQHRLRLPPFGTGHSNAMWHEIDLRSVDPEKPNNVTSRRVGRNDDAVRGSRR